MKFIILIAGLLFPFLTLATPMEIKGKNGTVVTLDVQSITHEQLLITKPGSYGKQAVALSQVDLDWLKEKQPELYKQHLAAKADYEDTKNLDPVPAAKAMAKGVIAGMRGGQVTQTWSYTRDDKGRITAVTVTDDARVQIGRTYVFLRRMVDTPPGKDTRRGMDVELSILASTTSRTAARLMELPNAASSIPCQKIADQLRVLSENVLKLQSVHSALDRTALEKVKGALDFLESQ